MFDIEFENKEQKEAELEENQVLDEFDLENIIAGILQEEEEDLEAEANTNYYRNVM